MDSTTMKRGKIEKHDCISALPDSLLIHILSFLPIKDAIKTGVLSKRWQLLWTSNPNLDFSDHPPRMRNSEYISIINKTLVLCGSSNVKKLRVNLPFEESDASDVHLWTRFAVKNRVEELIFDLYEGRWAPVEDCDFYELPQHFYANPWLRSLSLNLCQLVPAGLINWKALKNLSIGHVVLSENLIQSVLAGCPVLEFLELHYFRGVNGLNICSASVMKLVVSEYWSSCDPYNRDDTEDEEEDRKFDISGPNLRCLEISGCLHKKKCRVMNVPSLVKAKLNFDLAPYYISGDDEEDDRSDDEENEGDDSDHEEDRRNHEEHRSLVRELLESLRHVPNLALGDWCLQLVLRGLEAKGLPPSLSNRKHLEIDIRFANRDLPVIASLIGSSPCLETLVINMSFYNGGQYGSRFGDFVEHDETTYWTSRKRTFKCLQHLTSVTIVDFVVGDGCILEFLKFLLKKAKVLQRITIHVPKAASSSSSFDASLSRNFFPLAQTLLGFPRLSPQAVVIFSGLK